MDDVTDSPEPSQPQDELETAREWVEIDEDARALAWGEPVDDELLGDFDEEDAFDESSSEPWAGAFRCPARRRGEPDGNRGATGPSAASPAVRENGACAGTWARMRFPNPRVGYLKTINSK
jgi:hypothetical protein